MVHEFKTVQFRTIALDKELQVARSYVCCKYLMNVVVTHCCCNRGSWHVCQLALKPCSIELVTGASALPILSCLSG